MIPSNDEPNFRLESELQRLQRENDRLRGINLQLMDLAFPLDDFTEADAQKIMTETDGEPILSIIARLESRA